MFLAKKGNPNIAEIGKKTRFKKGKVANPGGQPKGIPHIATWIKRIGMEIAEGTKDKTYLEMVLRNAWVDAMNGDDKSREFLFNRAFGKVTDKMALTDSEGNDVQGAVAVPMMVFSSLKEAQKKLDEGEEK